MLCCSQRQNVATSMVRLKNGHIHKPQRYSWERRRKRGRRCCVEVVYVEDLYITNGETYVIKRNKFCYTDCVKMCVSQNVCEGHKRKAPHSNASEHGTDPLRLVGLINVLLILSHLFHSQGRIFLNPTIEVVTFRLRGQINISGFTPCSVFPRNRLRYYR